MSKLRMVLLSVLVLVIMLLTAKVIAKYVFDKAVDSEIEDLFRNLKEENRVITREDIAGLLKCAIWLEYTGVIGRERIASVYLKQKAEMRLERIKPGCLWNDHGKVGDRRWQNLRGEICDLQFARILSQARTHDRDQGDGQSCCGYSSGYPYNRKLCPKYSFA